MRQILFDAVKEYYPKDNTTWMKVHSSMQPDMTNDGMQGGKRQSPLYP